MNSIIRSHTKVIKNGYAMRASIRNMVVCHRTWATQSHIPLGRSTGQLGCAALRRRPVRSMPNYSAVMSVGSGYDQPFMYNYRATRSFHLSAALLDQPSSKVEATVQTMKNKQKEKVEEIMKEAAEDAAKATAAVAGSVGQMSATQSSEALKTVEVKKSLKTRIWEEVLHYYHGFRLLFIDINICRKLLWRVLNGKTLTRRENKLLVRTTSDLFRLIPFSVFIIVPFMELLLPVFIKFFPGMLPSTFQTAKEREHKLKQSLTVRLEMAKFLQKTLDEMAVQHKDHKSDEAKQFAEFFTKIRDPKEYVPSEDIIKFAKRFEDEITLDSLSHDQLAALCRVLELNTMGTSNLLRFLLRLKLRSLAADDRVIAREGVNALDLFELQQACKARGMRAYGLTSEKLRAQLQEWIDLSLNEKVPPTLLLLSRAMLISDDTTTTDKLKETIRVLPDVIAAQTKAAIGEKEGKIDNKTKIEIIKEEERKIKEEREEQREEEKAKAEILLDKAPIIDVSSTPKHDSIDSIVQLSNVAASTARKIASASAARAAAKSEAASNEKSITSEDVELLSNALKTLSSEKKMVVEKETIKDLKEELDDYKEDVEELHEVRNVIKEPVHESRAAKLLFKKVKSMIGQLDQVLADLEVKHQELQTKLGKAAESISPEEEALRRKQDDLVRIDELVNTIQKLKQTSDESRLKQIERVLAKLDTDKDGVITVDEVLKVIEAIGRENVNLDEKQVEDLIALLDKEQLIEAEEKIEKAIARSIKESKKEVESKQLEEQQKIIDAKELDNAKKQAAKVLASEELKDPAPELKDKATDLDATEKKNGLKTEGMAAQAAQTASLLEAAEKQQEKLIPKGEITPAMPTIPRPPPSSSATQVNSKDKTL